MHQSDRQAEAAAAAVLDANREHPGNVVDAFDATMLAAVGAARAVAHSMEYAHLSPQRRAALPDEFHYFAEQMMALVSIAAGRNPSRWLVTDDKVADARVRAIAAERETRGH